jgi:hypothetical protein
MTGRVICSVLSKHGRLDEVTRESRDSRMLSGKAFSSF